MIARLLRSCGAWLVVTLCVTTAATVQAQVGPDHPSALVIFPYVVVDTTAGTDTTIQLANTGNALEEVRCFYEDLTLDCTGGTPDQCRPGAVTCAGLCIPRHTRLTVRIRLTAMQPLAWRASTGLPDLPLDGVEHVGPLGMSNDSTDIPPLGSGPFTGTLRCVTGSGDPFRPSNDNVLVGQATLEQSATAPSAHADAAQYRAVGVAATHDVNGDEFLRLGGADAEYEACPNVMLLDHYFDGAPVGSGDEMADVSTTLVLTSCTSVPVDTTGSVVQFLVFNEFAQRFSSSRSVTNQLVTPLSSIETRDPQGSIFWYQVSGTLSGRTLMHPIGSGVHALAIESHRRRRTGTVQSDAFSAHSVDRRTEGDIVVYRGPRCVGDCNADSTVTVDEIISGVNIALGSLDIQRCLAIDANGYGDVTVDEIIAAINNLLNGCPALVLPTPTVAVVPTPTATPHPASVGPEITHLGIATADDRPVQSSATDEQGRPVFIRPFGQGMTLIVEARRGQSNSPIGTSTFSETGALPDLQVIASRALGNGDPAVCEAGGRSGGIPAIPNLEFNEDAATVAAINDLGCRGFGQLGNQACTRSTSGTGASIFGFAFVNGSSQVQFCLPIARAWALPVGDTVVAARVRDQAGNLGPVKEIVVRVLE